MTRVFFANADLESILIGQEPKRTYTWESTADTDLSLILNTCFDFEAKGWIVGIESPISGIQRSHRIPVIAVKENTVLVVKPVKDSKKVNISGLKMLDLKESMETGSSKFEVKAVVYAFLKDFDDRRKTSQDYEIWFRD